MLLKLAWRNIWRNTRRTLITVLALTFGIMALVTMNSFREVANAEMFRTITQGLVGHAQVHGRGYQESPDMSNLVPDPVAVEARLANAMPGVKTEKRVLGAGLAASGEVATAVMVTGIEPTNPSVGVLLSMKKGRALGPEPAREVVIGTTLAEQLGLAPGGELVLVGQAADGSLANDRFMVAGIADAGSFEANATAVFLHLADAQSFFALGEGVHQVIVRFDVVDDEEELSAPVSVLGGALDLQGLEIMPWTQILPELKGATDAKRKNMRALDFIVFLIVALGVLNTMTMSTLERTREFGVLASLGTRRRRILGMVVLEALLQGVIGFTAGVALAWALLNGLGTVDLSAMGGNTDVMGARLPEALQLAIHPPAVGSAALTTFFIMCAGGLLPSIRASRLKPVEATRYV